MHSARGHLVHMHLQRAAHGEVKRPQVVDAVRVVGVGMAQKDAVEPLDLGLDQLLAQIGRRVDRGPRSRRRRRSARQAPSSGGGGSSGSLDRTRPTLPRPAARRRTSRSPGWSDATSMRGSNSLRQLRQGPAEAWLAGGSLLKIAWVLARVASASASGVIPRASATTAAVETTKAGSLRRPRWGVGAR